MRQKPSSFSRERLYSRESLLNHSRHVIRHLLALCTLIDYFYKAGSYKDVDLQTLIRKLIVALQEMEDELESE